MVLLEFKIIDVMRWQLQAMKRTVLFHAMPHNADDFGELTGAIARLVPDGFLCPIITKIEEGPRLRGSSDGVLVPLSNPVFSMVKHHHETRQSHAPHGHGRRV